MAPTQAPRNQKVNPFQEGGHFTDEWWVRERRLIEREWKEEVGVLRHCIDTHEQKFNQLRAWKVTVDKTLETVKADIADLEVQAEHVNHLAREVENVAYLLEGGNERQPSAEAVQEPVDREGEGLLVAPREEERRTLRPPPESVDEGVPAPNTSIRKRDREVGTESSSEEGEVTSSLHELTPISGRRTKAKASLKSDSSMSLRGKQTGKGQGKKK
mgnify:CR=1 FL=1